MEVDAQVPLTLILRSQVDISESPDCVIAVVSYSFPIACLQVD